jgi:lysophospholipase L1-like esterase
VQKYIRSIITVLVCLVLIALTSGTALASSTSSSWLRNLLSKSPLTMLKSKQADTPLKTKAAQPKKIKLYAALGDSVAAGAGLASRTNQTGEDIACGRSEQGYPIVLANQLQAKLVFTACGGATTTNVMSGQQVGDLQTPSQLDTIFANGKPDLITLTIGANDIQWIQAINMCYSGDCNTDTASANIDARLTDYKPRLERLLNDITMRSNNNPPPVVLTGYYSLGSISCLSSIAPEAVTRDEIAWFEAQTKKLEADSASVAKEHKNVIYLNLDTTGHGVCEAKEKRWVQTIGEPAPFHLTAAGEQAFAHVIKTRLKQ